MKESYKLIFTVCFIFLILFVFNLLFAKPLPQYKVLKVENADEFYVDLNKNNKIDENEFIKLYDVNAFHNEINKNTYIQSKKLKLKQNEILALGVLAKEFSQKEFTGKNVQLEFFDIEISKAEKYSLAKIYFNKKDIGKILLNKGFASTNGKEKEYKKELNFINLDKQLARINKEKIVILDVGKGVVHSLNCLYSQTLKNVQALRLEEVYSDAKKCNLCFSDYTEKKVYKTNFSKKGYVKEEPFAIKNFDFKSGVLEFYFTDFNKRKLPDNECLASSCKALLSQINKAEKTIDFAIYGIAKQPQIINALVSAKNRGVKIRWVTDSNTKGENIYKEVSSVQKIFSDFKTDNHIYPLTGEKNLKYTNSIMHNKFFIFDDSVVWLGSSNLSQTDLADFNANINILANSKILAQIYKQEFEQMYNQKFHELKIQIQEKEDIKIDEENKVSVYFSPTDNIISQKIVPAINEAKKYIYISSFIITHKKIENALISASARGVDVKVITDATSSNGRYSIHNSLRSYKIPVKIENKAGKMHSKSIIIDDETVFVGSMNMTKSGESKNDENVLLIKNHSVAKVFKEQFLYLYSSIPDIYLTKTPRAEGWESIGSCVDGVDNNFDGLIDGDDIGCK